MGGPGSVATSVQSSSNDDESAGRGPSVGRGGGGGLKIGDDEVEQQTFETALFGCLFTLSKEKVNTSILATLFKLLVDWAQLFTLIVTPGFGWDINTHLIVWKILYLPTFQLVVQKIGYTAYIAINYVMVAALLANLLLCIFVTWSFKSRSFDTVWPIKVVRVFSSIFFQVFDVASMSFLQIAFDCRFFGYSAGVNGHLQMFPDVECLSMPPLIHACISAAALLIFVALATLISMAEADGNPSSKRAMAMSHTHVEVKAFLVKFSLTMTNLIFGGWPKVQNIMLLVLAAYLTYLYLRWEPHLVAWVNHVRVGLYSTVLWASAWLLVMTFVPHSALSQDTISLVMYIGIVPVALLSSAASYYRLNAWQARVWQRFRAAAPGTRPKDIWRFKNAHEVELAIRCLRKWVEDDQLDVEGVKLAEGIAKAALILLPGDAYVILLYSNILIDVMMTNQSGYAQVQAAKKANPNLLERFLIFSREQEHMQKATSAKSGETTVDLVSYVEFQRNHRQVLNAHKEALYAMRRFWKSLLRHNVPFTTLSSNLNKIEDHVSQAEKMYRLVLERYPQSAKLVRNYAKFLEHVRNDPWSASKYYLEADKLDAAQEEGRNQLSTGMQENDDGTLLTRVDERNNAVIVIDSMGIIQLINKVALQIFGYRKGDLDGKNVSLLMPPPFSGQHNSYLRAYVQTGKENILNRVMEVLALNKQKFVFPIHLAVSKVSGTGDDSMFMGVIEPIEPSKDLCKCWCLPTGLVAATDRNFSDWFGHIPQDMVGAHLFKSCIETDQVKTLFENLPSMPQDEVDAGRASLDVSIKHKYAESVRTRMTLKNGGSEKVRLVLVTLHRLHDEAHLVVTDRKGRIQHMNNALAEQLGVSAADMVEKKTSLATIIAPPFSSLHEKWLHDAPATHAASSSGCRSGSLTLALAGRGRIRLPVRPKIWTTELQDANGGVTDTLTVVQMQPSTFAAGLDERRLVLKVGTDGTIRELVSKECGKDVFGFNPLKLVGWNICSFIDVFRDCGMNGQPSTEEVLSTMVARAMERPGCGWRCGVMPPVDELDLHSLGPLAQAVLAQSSKAALMQVQLATQASPTDPAAQRRSSTTTGYGDFGDSMLSMALEAAIMADAAAGSGAAQGSTTIGGLVSSRASIQLTLWRSDILTGVLEVDKAGTIVNNTEQMLHQAGLLFGLPQASLPGMLLSKLLEIGGRSPIDLFRGSSSKKGAMKSGSKGAIPRVGVPRTLLGHHYDGADLELRVTMVAKSGATNKSYVVLHAAGDQAKGRPDFSKWLMQGGGSLAVDMQEQQQQQAARLLARQASRQGTVQRQTSQQSDGLPPVRAVEPVVKKSVRHQEPPPVPLPGLLLSSPQVHVLAPGAGGSVDARRASADAPRASVDAPRASVDAPRASVDIRQASEKHVAGTSAPKAESPSTPRQAAALWRQEQGSPGNENGTTNPPASGVEHESVVPFKTAEQRAEEEASDEERGPAAGLKTTASYNARTHYWIMSGGESFDEEGLEERRRARSSLAAQSATSAPSGNGDGAGENGADAVALLSCPPGLDDEDGGARDDDHELADAKQSTAVDNEDDAESIAESPIDGAISGSTSLVEEEEAGYQADYRQGKRYKKLLRMMGSPAACVVRKHFMWHTLLSWLVLLIVHSGCFAIIIIMINKQELFLEGLDSVGKASEAVHGVTIAARALDAIYKGINPVALYGPEDIPRMEEEIELQSKILHSLHTGVYLGFSSLKELPKSYGLRDIWKEQPWPITIVYDVGPPAQIEYLNMTLWDVGNHFIAAAREVRLHHALWAQTGNLSDHSEFAFLMDNGPWALFNGYLETQDAMVYEAVGNSNNLNTLQLVLLLVEGLVVCAMLTLYVFYHLRRVTNQRYSLYTVFFVIPVALTRSMASRQVKLDEEDEDDNDDDAVEAALGAQEFDGDRNTAEASDVAQPGAVHISITAAQHGSTSFMPLAAPRPTFKSQASNAFSSVNARNAIGGQSGGQRLWMTLKQSFARLGSRRSSEPGTGKRHLVLNSREPWVLLLPIVLWGLVVVATYSVCYSTIRTVPGPTATLNIVNMCIVRVARIAHFTQELILLPHDSPQYATLASKLSARLILTKQEYAVMLDGYHTSIPDRHFQLVTQGVAFSNKEDADLLYRAGDCLRFDQQGCAAPGTTYYEVTHQGIDAMMKRLFLETELLLRDNRTAVGPNSTRFDYMWSVALSDLVDGLKELDIKYLASVEKYFNTVKVIHITVFVISVVMSVFFLLFLLRPFLRRVDKESRRIAELLSHLPGDLDIENIVARALHFDKDNKPTGMAPATDEEAAAPVMTAAGAGSISTRGPKSFLSGLGSRRSLENLMSGRHTKVAPEPAGGDQTGPTATTSFRLPQDGRGSDGAQNGLRRREPNSGKMVASSKRL